MITKQQFATKLLSVCQGYADAGTSRRTTPDQVARFLELFGLPYRDEKGRPLAYCASGLSYAACKAYAFLHNQPASGPDALRPLMGAVANEYFPLSPRVNDIYQSARRRGIWVAKGAVSINQIKPGWLILYQFDNDAEPDHIEIVKQAYVGRVEVIGFNTSGEMGNGVQADGGAVIAKTRPYNTVLGYVGWY